MLALIIRKEILDNLLNTRFIIAGVVSIVLIVASLVVLTRSHEAEVRDYDSRVAAQDDFIDHFAHSNRIDWMSRLMRPPAQLQVMALGIERESEQPNFVSNPVPVLLSRFDFVSIVTLILSLLAILFSYGSICGEREAGLLRLMLSNGVPRTSVVLGKLIGGIGSILVPFSLGFLAGLIYLSVDVGFMFGTQELTILILLLLGSCLLIAAFDGIGLLCSAWSHTPAQALLKGLSVWVLFVLVIPNVSPFLAARLIPGPSVAKTEKEVTWVESDERDRILRDRTQGMLQTRFPDLTSVTRMNQSEIRSRSEADPVFRDRYAAYAKAFEEMVAQVNSEQHAIGEKIRATSEEKSAQQEQFAKLAACLSPVSNFIFIATDLAETGIAGDNHWRDQQESYSRALGEFTQQQYAAEKAKNPAFSFNDYLDMRARPRFHYVPQPIGDRARLVLAQFAILALFNLVFFTAAYVRFLRYDVR